MSRTFSDSLAQDLAATFFNTNEFAELVTIRRNGVSTHDVPAIVSARNEMFGESGFVTSVEAFDFLFDKTAYIVGGLESEPRQGDRLIRANGVECMVLAVTAGQCVDPGDSEGTTIRVHTKKVA